MKRSNVGRLAWMLALGIGPAAAWAETVDVIQPIGTSAVVGASASLTVTARNVSNDAINGTSPGTVGFGTVTGANPWKVAPQYLRLQHQSNNASWAVRVLTNNRSTFSTMVGKVLDPGADINDPNDDILGYGGLIGTDPTNPNDRVALGWQVFKNTLGTGVSPAAPTDNDFLAPAGQPTRTDLSNWAFIADASDCPKPISGPANCRASTPPTIDKTGEYFRVTEGDAVISSLLRHPPFDPLNPTITDRASDGDVAVYLSGRFGASPADPNYRTTIIVELYHF